MKRGKSLFIEFAVIVLGVLVALLMESAWQDHQDGQLAREYLERLSEEAEFNREVLRSDSNFMAQNCRAATQVRQVLAGAAELSPERLVLNAWAAALNYRPTYKTATWEDLLASGRIGLIDSADTRARIIDLYQLDLDLWRTSRDDPFRNTVVRVLPGDLMAGIAKDCLTLTGFAEDFEACALERLDNAEPLAQQLLKQPDILEQLNDRTYYACNFDRWLKEYERLLDALEQSLN